MHPCALRLAATKWDARSGKKSEDDPSRIAGILLCADQRPRSPCPGAANQLRCRPRLLIGRALTTALGLGTAHPQRGSLYALPALPAATDSPYKPDPTRPDGSFTLRGRSTVL